MLKLYKKTDEKVLYAECWMNSKTATIHTGVVGNIGRSREVSCKNETAFLNDFQKHYKRRGYERCPENEQFWVVLQWPMKTLEGNTYNRGMRDSATKILNEGLGWLGLGHVDGFDMGRTANPKEEFALNIFCLVVDLDIAIQHIVDTIPKQLDCSRVKIASRRYDEESFTLNYCAKPKENWFYI